MTDTATPVQASQPVRKSYQSAKNARRDTPMIVEIDGTEFTLRPGRVPGTALIDFQGLVVTRDPEAMWAYFRACFPDPEKFEEFRDFINDPEREVDINLLFDIIKDLIEEGSGSPTARSSS
jgi:hypothetical protein